MTKAGLLICFLLVLFNTAITQPTFILNGKVEFEKKQNMYALLRKGNWSDEMKRNLPQFRSTFFDLYFTPSESLYKPGKETEEHFTGWWNDFAAENVVYNNYETQLTAQQKLVFGKKFIEKDTLLNIEWKLTDDTRKIAGFECKKAIGRMLDSVLVVAFYAQEIVGTGGPESFHGLPGLILGVAFPRMHTTWFATKLELQEIKKTDLISPEKGKLINRKELIKLVFTAIEDRPTAGQDLLEMLF